MISSSARSQRTTDASCRSIRDGRTSGFGFLDDYANVALGLLELHVATGELRWLLEARRLALLAVELFADDEHGGFFLSPADGDARVARTKDLQDTPIPSGNSMLAYVLLRLSRIWGDDDLERRAVSVFRLVEPALRRAPGFFAWTLCAIDLWLSPPREIAIVGDVGSPVARAALAPFQPDTVVAVGPSEEVPLLAGKRLVGGEPAVYVCERFACRAPVTRTGGGGGLMRVCLMIEGQEGVTWDDWVRLARADRGARARRALPLRSLHGDHPAGRRRARCVGDACGPGRDHESHPARHDGLSGDVPAPERARAHGGHGRPHLGWPRRGRDGIRLVRARARGARLPVPRRKGSGSSSSPSRSRSSSAPGPRSASTTTGLPTGYAASRRFRVRVQQPHPPLVLGGTVKPRFAALAARYATEVNTLGAPNEELRERKAALDRACAEVGRDPATLGYSVMTSCFVGETSADVRRSRRSLPVDPRRRHRPRARSCEARRDRWLVGTVDEVAERIEELRELGVTRVFLQHLNHDDDAMIALVGGRLLPALW